MNAKQIRESGIISCINSKAIQNFVRKPDLTYDLETVLARIETRVFSQVSE